jgi:putative restriction endonuclease
VQFDEWMKAKGLSEKTISNYYTAIEGSLSAWARNAGIINGSILDIADAKEMAAVVLKIKQIPLFVERDHVGHGMYAASLTKYSSYLDEISRAEEDFEVLSNDIKTIITEVQTSVTEKLQLVNARIGQGQYRKNLIELWGACSVTHYPNCSILVASHIKPWSMSTAEERLDRFNGLLLVPNIDKLFDMGLISFGATGAILISNSLEQPEALGIRKDMSVSLSGEHEVYMKFHRENVFLDALLDE